MSTGMNRTSIFSQTKDLSHTKEQNSFLCVVICNIRVTVQRLKRLFQQFTSSLCKITLALLRNNPKIQTDELVWWLDYFSMKIEPSSLADS